MTCHLTIPGTAIACGEGGNYCSEECKKAATERDRQLARVRRWIDAKRAAVAGKVCKDYHANGCDRELDHSMVEGCPVVDDNPIATCYNCGGVARRMLIGGHLYGGEEGTLPAGWWRQREWRECQVCSKECALAAEDVPSRWAGVYDVPFGADAEDALREWLAGTRTSALRNPCTPTQNPARRP